MHLFVRCKECYSSIKIKRFEIGSKVDINTRFDLIRKFGAKEFTYCCKKCSSEREYHVNDVRARLNSTLVLVFFLLALIIGVLLLIWVIKNFWDRTFYLYIIAPTVLGAPFMIYSTYIISETNIINEFNSERY